MSKNKILLYIFIFLLVIFLEKSHTESEIQKVTIFYQNQISEMKSESVRLNSEIKSLNLRINLSQNVQTEKSQKITKYPNGMKTIENVETRNLHNELKNELSSIEIKNVLNKNFSESSNKFENYNLKEEIIKQKNNSNINLYGGPFFPSASEGKFDEFQIISGFLYQKSALNYGGFISFEPTDHTKFGIASTFGISF